MANGDLIKLGTFYLNGVKQPRPAKPWRTDSTPPGAPSAGDIPVFSAGQSIEIRDTDSDDAYKIQWREVNDGGKKLLISDRVLLVNVSWDDLNAQGLIFGKTITINGQQYKLRVLTGGSNYRSGTDAYSGGSPSDNEWDRIIVNEAGFSGLPIPSATDLDSTQNSTDFNSAHNQFWNWFYIYSWAQETYTGNSANRALRGYGSARRWGWDSATYRSYDVGWRPVLEVLNSAPVISGNNQNLGEKITPFAIDYTVNDTDTTDTLTITEKVNNTTIRTVPNAVRNQQYTVNLSDVWSTLALGSHTVTITVDDGKGGTATRTYTFTKTDDRIIVRGKNPIQTSLAAGEIVVSGIVKLATGATIKVEVCNNGFDAIPTWEDATTEFINKEAYSFTNKLKTASNWGVNFRVTLLKNNATEKSYIEALGINFGRG